MEPLVRVQPDEVARLAMENELLRYEALHLRARLAAAEQAVTRAERTITRLRENPQAGQRAAEGGQGKNGRNEARDDLVWLLERLDRSIAGPALRRRPGFQALRDKYLGGSRA